MKDLMPNLRFYSFTGSIGCKCETCGWTATTSYVTGETADQTVRRVFGNHICRPIETGESTAEYSRTV